jgi:hypothetical protein
MQTKSSIRWLWLAVIVILTLSCSIDLGTTTEAPAPIEPVIQTEAPASIPPTVAPPTATPLPTETPLPTPTPGPIVVNDDFSADTGNFKCDSCVIESGALTIGPFPMVDSWKPFVALCEPCGTAKNFKLSVETWYADGNSNRGFGVVVRQDNKFIYMVAMSSWQVYNVFEFDTTAGGGAGYRSLIGNWSKGGLGAGRAVHFIDITMQDGSMTLTINKDFTRVFEIPSNDGKVGLWTGSWETSASFDNFHYEEIK